MENLSTLFTPLRMNVQTADMYYYYLFVCDSLNLCVYIHSYISATKQCSSNGSKGQIHTIGLFSADTKVEISLLPYVALQDEHTRTTAVVKVRVVVVISLPARGRQGHLLIPYPHHHLRPCPFCSAHTHTSVFHSSFFSQSVHSVHFSSKLSVCVSVTSHLPISLSLDLFMILLLVN